MEKIEINRDKPLNGKAYGSIPHLMGSHMGIGDKRIHIGQHNFICNKKRKNDFVIVQEKVDGSCVSVCKIDGKIIALSRAGYLASSSPYIQHHWFSKWVDHNRNRFDNLLREGERAVGEWILQTHGTKIRLHHEPFVIFDIYMPKEKRGPRKTGRITVSELWSRAGLGFNLPKVVSTGESFGEANILDFINNGTSGHGAEKIEGVVCRVETDGEFNFIAKYVRHDYEAGKYMKDEIYNQGYKEYFPFILGRRKGVKIMEIYNGMEISKVQDYVNKLEAENEKQQKRVDELSEFAKDLAARTGIENLEYRVKKIEYELNQILSPFSGDQFLSAGVCAEFLKGFIVDTIGERVDSRIELLDKKYGN